MLSIVLKCLVGVGFVASGWFAAMPAPPAGCKLRVQNLGTAELPNYKATCYGDCVAPAANPCEVDSLIFWDIDDEGNRVLREIWWCKCNGVLLDVTSAQACVGNFNDAGGWHFVCETAQCAKPCDENPLPGPGATVDACVCPP